MGASLTWHECTSYVSISPNQVSYWLYSSLDTAMITAFVPTTWFLGLLANLSFLLVMFRVPKLRSDTNLYLAHLAIADVLYLSLSSLYLLLSYAGSPVSFQSPFGSTAFTLIYIALANTCYYGSIWLVTVVSLERYLALCHPMKHLIMRGRRRTYKLIAICWLLGLLFAAPTLLLVGRNNVICLFWRYGEAYRGLPTVTRRYSPITPWVPLYVIPLVNIPWFIAMVANIYMYVGILQTLNKRTEEGGVASNDQNAVQVRNQVAKMLIVNGMIFFLCQTPYRVINLSSWVCAVARIPVNPIEVAVGNSNRWVTQAPQYINGVINPLIYGVINRAVRAAFTEVFCCRSEARAPGHAAISPSAQQASSAPQTSATDMNTDEATL